MWTGFLTCVMSVRVYDLPAGYLRVGETIGEY